MEKQRIIEILKTYQDPAEDLNHGERGTALFSHLFDTVADEILEEIQPKQSAEEFVKWYKSQYDLFTMNTEGDLLVHT